MNNNDKKNIFNKRNIIIFGCVCIVSISVFLLIYLPNNSSVKSKTEIVKCYVEKQNPYGVYNVTQKVKYVDGVFSNVELEQKIKFSEKILKIRSLDFFKNEFDSKFQEVFNEISDSLEYFVKIDNGMLSFGYNLKAEDYKVLEKKLKDTSEGLTSTDNFYDDKNRFINQIINQGGECTYE